MEYAEAAEFIKELETRLGSRITWRTFATWFGSSEGQIREYGVFLCALEDGRFYAEDFERLPQILGYTIRQKNRPKYEKYSIIFPKESIKSISVVRKSQAESSSRAASRVPLSPAGRFSRIFFPLVTQVVLDDGRIYFFELIEPKALIKLTGEENGRSI